nr:CHC2 zinc finger domain-containing protein [uncultured Desulfobacter sp.]
MIEQSRINTIKTCVDLKAYIEQATGAAFKKNGKGYVCRCPFPDHEDKTPSFVVTPRENLWNCFGCGRGGDIFEFDHLYFNLDFKTSVQKHEAAAPASQKAVKNKKETGTDGLTVKDQKLLARVVSYYQHTLGEDPKGMAYLKTRGITDNQSLTDFGAGFANGTLLNILPEDADIIKSLKKIGILNTRGKEVFFNCVVFPLYDDKGAVVNLYGRNIDDDCQIKHLYLPGKRTGLVNRQAAKRSQTLVLTESIIDALTLYDQGFKNVMPIYGTNGLIDDHLFFFNRKIKEAYLVFDADDAGRNASRSVSEQLKEKNIICHVIELPVKDVNLYFNRHTPEEFETLLKQANPRSLEQSDKINNRKQTLYNETDQGFMVGYGDRQYQVKGIQRGDTQLKATIKASTDVEGNALFELTTIDLYSSRSRTWFAKLCADLFRASPELVREDIGRLLTLVENFTPKQAKAQGPKTTKEETRLAMAFLKSPNLMEEILADLAVMGVIGEEINKTVCYLAATSRKLAKPISILIQSRSSAGKSTLQNAVLSLMPEEEYENYTRVTDQSLFYKEEDSLVHKILAIEEDVGMGGAAYSIRNIQSSGRITVATTGKDPGTGKMKTEDYTVKGPVTVMLTTTAADLDQETASRFIFLSIDESPAMTAAIHEKQRESRTLKGLVQKTKTRSIIKKHQNAQRLLKPIAVVNEFTPYLSYPSQSLVTRRDHEKYLGLIDAIAFLHQCQREIKTMEIDNATVAYIEVTLDDIDRANRIANEVLGQSLDELARPSRTLLDAVSKMVNELAEDRNTPMEEIYFTRRMIREYMDWSDWQIKTHIKQLEDLEYLYIRMGSRGKEYAYALNYKGQGEDNSRFFLNLTPVEEIQRLMAGAKEAAKGG